MAYGGEEERMAYGTDSRVSREAYLVSRWMSGTLRFTNSVGESAHFVSTDRYDPPKLARYNLHRAAWISPNVRASFPTRLVRMVGLAATCERLHGSVDAVAESDGEHCSKFCSDEVKNGTSCGAKQR